MTLLALSACAVVAHSAREVDDGAAPRQHGDAGSVEAPAVEDAGNTSPVALRDGSNPDQAAQPPLRFPLCDGSPDVRLSISHEGGELAPDAWYFSHPYGIRFFFLNGRCEYVVSAGGERTWRHGVLTDERAQQLASALHLSALPRWTTKNQDRWIGGLWFIRANGATYACGDCKNDGPPDAIDAVANIPRLLTELEEAAAPLTGALEIVVLRDDDLSGTEPAWPLAWHPADIAIADDATSMIDLESAARTLAGEEAKSLRALRDERYQPFVSGAGLALQHEGRAYFVTMRDVLPASFQTGSASEASPL